MRAAIALLLQFSLVITFACNTGASSQEDLQAEVVAALDALVEELVADRPDDAVTYIERLQAYLEAHPAFYGGAVALLNRDGNMVTSPYVYRTDDGYVTLDLAVPSYNIDSQDWVKAPLAANAGVWTEPYFDAGGGEVWMVTRSVPVRDAEAIFAIITTDLAVGLPQSNDSRCGSRSGRCGSLRPRQGFVSHWTVPRLELPCVFDAGRSGRSRVGVFAHNTWHLTKGRAR